MKTSGIVKRIDELGRIVIPKEIRKSLRIKEGCQLEITILNDEIVLSKHSPILEYSECSSICAEILYDKLSVPIFVTDLNNLVASAGVKYIKHKLKDETIKLIEKRTIMKLENYDNKIFQNETSAHKNLFISPIIIDGDVFGSIIVDYKQDTQEMLNVVKFATTFISKMID